MTRKSQWAYSLPFSLNATFVGSSAISLPFSTPTMGIVPILAEFNKTQADPSGYRHLTSHAAFSEILASGEGIASLNSGRVDMSTCDISSGSGISKTRVFLFRIDDFKFPDTRVHNLKIWCSSQSDFLTPQYAKIVFERHRTWKGDYNLPVEHLADRDRWLPMSEPEQQNLWRQDGGWTIHGYGDTDVSEWIYVAIAASGTLPLGVYGGTAASGLLLRVTFDADNLPLAD